MSLVYGIIAMISLCMVGICVAADKKRDVWLLLVFVSVSICNLGYFMLSVSKDLDGALNSNRISYLGSVYLPFFLFMMVLRFCRIKRSKFFMVMLFVIGIFMLGITTSPGILPIYYRTVDIQVVDGTTKLIREYGPLHLLYYVYLFSYMMAMSGVTFFAIVKKKISSRLHTVLLLCAVFCNIVIWLVEQFLPRGFEWLSISYILTECLMLAIYRSMQKQGFMSKERRSPTYTINVLLFVFLLFFASFLRIVTQGITPAFYIISHMMILMIYLGILISWGASVYDRIINKNIRHYLVGLVGLMIFWMLVRTLRHTVFLYVYPLKVWCWYAYYISMILIPQFCFFAAKYIGRPEEYKMPKKWHFMYLPPLLLMAGIFVKDFYNGIFQFQQGKKEGWDIVQHNILYYIAAIWMFACIAMMIAEFLKRCRIPGTHKIIWMPIAMLGVAVLYTVLYAFNSDLFGFIEITAAICFTIVAIWESSIKTGIIQSNTHYDELLKYSGLGVAVVDQKYMVHYSSKDALPLTKEQMEKAKDSPLLLEGGIRVSSHKIRGGYTLWQEDLSDFFGILEELKGIRQELQGANEVSMQNYQMDKKMHALVEKNRLQDELHKQMSHQIDLLNDWLRQMIETSDEKEKRELLRHIVVVGAYFKRRNNLILVNEQEGMIQAEELRLSLQEMMKNLQLAGIHCGCTVQFEKNLPSEIAMKLFDFYEYVVENAFDGLECLLARFFYREDGFYACIDALCSQDLTQLKTEEIAVSISETDYYTLSLKVGGDGKS